jgi:ABC-type glycerol-3-phosphate transport system substrate-binding protein
MQSYHEKAGTRLSRHPARSGIRSIHDILALAAALLVLLAVSAACVPADAVVFPTTGTSARPTGPVSTTSSSTPDLPQRPVTIATGYSREVAEYLGMLYYSRITGVFPENGNDWIGDTVNLEELAQFRDSFPVEALQIEPGGAGEARIRAWAAAGRLPDLYLTDRVAACAANGWAADITYSAGAHRLLNGMSLYPVLVEGAKSGARLFGIPITFTMPVLMYDRDAVYEAGLIPPLDSGWEFGAFAAALETAAALVQPETGTTVSTGSREGDNPVAVPLLPTAEGLLELLPAGMDTSLGWAAWTGSGFGFDRNAFREAAGHVESLLLKGLTADRLDPDLFDSAAIWLGDSSQIAGERLSLEGSLALSRIPYLGSERIGVRVQTLCVSPEAAETQTIVDFAMFIALDPDALLLASRFGRPEGYLPVSRVDRVWDRTMQSWPSLLFLNRVDHCSIRHS